MAKMPKEISMSDVKKHQKATNCWIVIHNEVYDVSKFMKEHPCGEDSLMEYAGKDATQAFEDVGHSDDARSLMKKFKVGSLPPGEHKEFEESWSNMKWYLLALATAILAGIVIKKYSQG